MPSYGQTVTLQYVAWDTSANAGKTGDVANHTLKWVKDGTSSSVTNSAAEVDSTNAPGVYKLVMTATEASCQVGTLCGKSSTSNVVIIPITVTFENLPTASPNAAGGLLTYGSSTGQLNPSSGAMPVSGTVTLAAATHTGATIPTVTTVTNAVTAGTVSDKTGYSLSTSQTFNTSGSVGSVTGAVGSVTGAVGSVTGNVGGNVAGSVASVTGAVGSVTGNVGGNVVGTVASVVTKTGYILDATGLDAVAVTDPGGVANTFPKMVVQLWRRFFKGSAKNAGAGEIYTYADNGTTVRTTQSYTDDGAGNETLGAAS